jgi:general secretion pathway protein I
MKNEAGFTLIEVLIALAILTIALTAIIKSTAQTTKHAMYLQNKVVASWVGTEVMNEALAGILKLPNSSEGVENETAMLGRKWPWKASLSDTPNPHIKKVSVEVFLEINHTKLIHLESYLYAAS